MLFSTRIAARLAGGAALLALSVPSYGQQAVTPNPVPPPADDLIISAPAPPLSVVLPEQPILTLPKNDHVIVIEEPVTAVEQDIEISVKPANTPNAIPHAVESVNPAINIAGIAAPGLTGTVNLMLNNKIEPEIAESLIPRAVIAPLMSTEGDLRIALQDDSPKKANEAKAVPTPNKDAKNEKSEDKKKEEKPAVRKVRGRLVLQTQLMQSGWRRLKKDKNGNKVPAGTTLERKKAVIPPPAAIPGVLAPSTEAVPQAPAAPVETK